MAILSRATVSSGSAPTTTATRRRFLGRGDVRLGQGQDEPIDADPEADPRRRAAAQELDEPVVAPAAADRLLLALTTDDVELERGPGVVVEATDEPRLQSVGHAQRVEVVANAGEVLRACLAQVVGDLRGQRR